MLLLWLQHGGQGGESQENKSIFLQQLVGMKELGNCRALLFAKKDRTLGSQVRSFPWGP